MTWHIQLSCFEGALAIDLPGHPEGSGFSTIEEYADSVDEYIKKNHIESPVLVGHSMGGAIAIECALRDQNLAGIVLVGTGARLRIHPDILSKLKENYEEACRLVASWSLSPNSDPIIRDRILNEMLKVKPDITYNDFAACDRFDRMFSVERISLPTLVICGADDKLTPVKYSQYLQSRIRNSKLIVIRGAGHMVMLEKPRLVNEAIEAFLDGL